MCIYFPLSHTARCDLDNLSRSNPHRESLSNSSRLDEAFFVELNIVIKFELTTITPDMARSWLNNNNEGNRSIKSQVVNKYARDLTDKKWRVTHQCIAFDSTGMLVDGQHRLSAVVFANQSMMAYVACYQTAESAMKLPIDMQAKRAVYDVLQVSRRDQETVMAALRLIKTCAALPTMSEIEIAINNARDILDVVHKCLTSTVKYRSAAPARAAIMCLLHEYPDRAEYIAQIYRMFVAMDLQELPSSVLALLKNLDGNTLKSGGSDQRELLLRVYYAFSPANFGVKIIRLADPDSILRHIRETAKWLIQ